MSEAEYEREMQIPEEYAALRGESRGLHQRIAGLHKRVADLELALESIRDNSNGAEAVSIVASALGSKEGD